METGMILYVHIEGKGLIEYIADDNVTVYQY